MVHKDNQYIAEQLSNDEYIKVKETYQKYLMDIIKSGHPGSTPIYKFPIYYEKIYKKQVRLDRIKSIRNRIDKKQNIWNKITKKKIKLIW